MVFLKTDEEVELMRAANTLVGQALGEIAKYIKPGVSTLKLDQVAEEFIRDNGATPAFLGFDSYPNSICTSINDQVVHGIPSSNTYLKEGDVISVDCGTVLNGFVGDSAYTFCVGAVDRELQDLLQVTKDSLFEGIKSARSGKRTGDIGHAVYHHCKVHHCTVVRVLFGHGIGKSMHEDPLVPNYGFTGTGALLKSGMCICIEPMITLGSSRVKMDRDGWTIRTRNGKCSAHFEHCIVIRPDGPQLLSSYKFVEEVLNKNSYLN